MLDSSHRREYCGRGKDGRRCTDLGDPFFLYLDNPGGLLSAGWWLPEIALVIDFPRFPLHEIVTFLR
jgi:hypothetical protein